jgi:hypothetical protein
VVSRTAIIERRMTADDIRAMSMQGTPRLEAAV